MALKKGIFLVACILAIFILIQPVIATGPQNHDIGEIATGTVDEQNQQSSNISTGKCTVPSTWKSNGSTHFLCLDTKYSTSKTIHRDSTGWAKNNEDVVYFVQTIGKNYGFVGYHFRYQRNSTVVALNTSNEKIVWSRELNSVYAGWSNYEERSMTIHNGTMYLLTPRSRILALNATSGEQVWSQNFSDKKILGRENGWRGGVRVQNNTLIVRVLNPNSRQNSRTILLDPRSGEQFESLPADTAITNVDTDLLIHSPNSTVRYDPENQEVVWTGAGVYSVIDVSWMTPKKWFTHYGAHPVKLEGYNAYGGPNQIIFLNTRTGKLREQPYGPPRFHIGPTSSATGRNLLVSGLQDEENTRRDHAGMLGTGSFPTYKPEADIYRIYSADGDRLWQKRITGPESTSGDTEATMSNDGELVYIYIPWEQDLIALGVNDGKEHWREDFSGSWAPTGTLGLNTLKNGTIVFRRPKENTDKSQRILIDETSHNIIATQTVKYKTQSQRYDTTNVSGGYSIKLNRSADPDQPPTLRVRNEQQSLVAQENLSGESFNYRFVKQGDWGLLLHDPDAARAILYEVSVVENTPPSSTISGDLRVGSESEIEIHVKDDGHGGPFQISWTITKPTGESMQGGGRIQGENETIVANFKEAGEATVAINVSDQFGAKADQKFTVKVQEEVTTTEGARNRSESEDNKSVTSPGETSRTTSDGLGFAVSSLTIALFAYFIIRRSG